MLSGGSGGFPFPSDGFFSVTAKFKEDRVIEPFPLKSADIAILVACSGTLIVYPASPLELVSREYWALEVPKSIFRARFPPTIGLIDMY